MAPPKKCDYIGCEQPGTQQVDLMIYCKEHLVEVKANRAALIKAFRARQRVTEERMVGALKRNYRKRGTQDIPLNKDFL